MYTSCTKKKKKGTTTDSWNPRSITWKSDIMNWRPKTFMEEDDEVIARSQHSLSAPNPVDSSSAMKQRSPMETKKRMAPKKPSSFKSKAKQLASGKLRKSGRGKRTKIDDLYNNVEAKLSVMERAEELLANLAAEFPSFIKCMLPSNVAHGFWLIFPTKFCNLHLPRHDATVILEDECGKEYKTKYLLERHGLSGGWRGFSIAHRLLKGDVLVFHLVGPCKLKVHIVRVYGLEEVDAALCLMNLDACGKRRDSDHGKKDNRVPKKAKKWASINAKKQKDETLLLDIHQPREDIQKNGLTADQFESSSDSFCSEVMEGSEITNHLQSNGLGCCESLFLHDHLCKGINCR